MNPRQSEMLKLSLETICLERKRANPSSKSYRMAKWLLEFSATGRTSRTRLPRRKSKSSTIKSFNWSLPGAERRFYSISNLNCTVQPKSDDSGSNLVMTSAAAAVGILFVAGHSLRLVGSDTGIRTRICALRGRCANPYTISPRARPLYHAKKESGLTGTNR